MLATLAMWEHLDVSICRELLEVPLVDVHGAFGHSTADCHVLVGV